MKKLFTVLIPIFFLFSLNSSQAQITVTLTDSTMIDCNGNASGSLNITATGGAEPYFYSWTGPDGYESFDEDITGLAAGEYNVEVYDEVYVGNGGPYVVTEPALLINNSTLYQNESPTGGFDGIIQASATGGDENYTFSIIWPSSHAEDEVDESNQFTGLEADTYIIHVFDENNCPSEDVEIEVITEGDLERDALIALYEATNGDDWTNNSNWKSEYPLSYWYGVITDEDGLVVELNLDDNNLVGMIPPQIGDLPELKILHFKFNELSGSIPSEFGNLDKLEFFYFNSNQLSGSIPPEMGNMASLKLIKFFDNQLSGSIPPEIFNITTLESIDMGMNQLTGIIPSEIGDLTSLTSISFRNNKLSGVVPYTIANLPLLTNLWVHDNDFDEWPVELMSLSFDNIKTENNRFTFEDLENLPTAASYDPQKTYHAYDTTYLNEGVEGLIQLDFDNEVSGSSYDWYREGDFVSTTSGNSIIITENNPGTVYFTLEITNATFGSFVLSVDSVIVVVEDCGLFIESETIEDVQCNGNSDGSIDILVSDGAEPYVYAWTGPNDFNSVEEDIDGLEAGEYFVTVTDDLGCTADGGPYAVLEPTIIVLTEVVTDVLCYADASGVIELTAIGGTSPYEYSIDDGNNYQTNPIFDGLMAGEYSTYVRDANDCISNHLITITEPESLPTVSFTGLDEQYCFDASSAVLTGNQAPEGIFSGAGITDNGDGTAGFDPVMAGIGGPYDIIYLYSNEDGCSNADTMATVVNPAPEISFTGLDDTYCIGSGIVVLTGSEAPDGTFSGVGIIDNGDGTANFDPDLAGVGGPYGIVYQYTDENSCSGEYIEQTMVNNLPDVSFSGLEIAYCIDGETVVITGNQAPDGTFTGQGIIDNGNGTATFDPAIAGLGGPYDIIYSYTNTEGCENTEIQQTSVVDVPIVSFTGLDPNYCSADASVTLIGSEAPYGSFSGSGVFDQGDGTALFYPVVVGVGDYNINYTFENASGCAGTDTQSTTVNEQPLVGFTGLDATYCKTDASVELTGSEAPNGTFSGSGITDNGDGTATFDPLVAGAGGPYEISYSFTTNEGCSDNDIQEVDIFDVDELSFTLMNATYCTTDATVELIGNLAPGGSFSGEGITDNGDGTAIFDPTQAAIGGPYAILYSKTNANNCYAEVEQTVEIIETPVVTFTGLDAMYCVDGEAVLLSGDEPLGSYTGDGITDNGDGTATFDPPIAGAGGPYTIIFTYTNAGGCTGEYRQDVQVIDYISVSFTDLDDEYCQYAEGVLLTGSEAPFGSFVGEGITDNADGTAYFSPETAGVGGPYNIIYSYENEGVCMSTITQSVMVKASTEISFTGLAASYCDVDMDYLITGSQAPDGNFTGEGITDNGDGTAYFNPSVLGTGGPYLVSYHYEDGIGCVNYVEQTTEVQDDPTADFTFDLGGCNEDAIFVDQSYSPNGLISSWVWNFDDLESDNNNSTDQNPLHLFESNQSNFNVELEVTDEMGCVNTIVKAIQPYSTVAIQGHIVSNGEKIITDGYVLAYLLSDGVISTLEDSVQIQNDGSYLFEEMASCVDYIFHAYSNPDLFPSIMPRWHIDANYWFSADPISVAWDDVLVEDIDIVLYEIIPQDPGSSVIEGGIYYAGSKGEPVKNIDVVLEFDEPIEKEDEIVGYQATNEAGNWRFEGLPEGVFRIKIDIPGLNMDSVYTVEITQANTIITGLDYYVDTISGIYIDFTGLNEYNKMPFGSLSIFPNPNNGHFYLDIQKSANMSKLDITAIELWDMEGRLIKDFNITYQGEHYLSTINIDNIQAGMYFIKVRNKGVTGVVKFVIQY